MWEDEPMRYDSTLKGEARMRERERQDAWRSQKGLERADYWADREIVMRRDLQEGRGSRRFHAVARDGKAISGRLIGEDPSWRDSNTRFGLCSAIVELTGRVWAIELDSTGWPTGRASAIDPDYDPRSMAAMWQALPADHPDAGRMLHCHHCMRLMWDA